MNHLADASEAKWEIAELRGSLFALSRDLADIRAELDRAAALAMTAPTAEPERPVATRPANLPVARVVHKPAVPVARRTVPTGGPPEFQRMQPIRLTEALAR
jgi:hypothetical protein